MAMPSARPHEPDADRAGRQYARRAAERAYGTPWHAIVRGSERRRRWLRFLYAPTTELTIVALIVVSVVLLTAEVLTNDGNQGGGWLGALAGRYEADWFLWADVSLSALFAVEYVSKLVLAPRRWFFVRTHWIDLLAILPILRVFRIGRVVRLFRLFRLLRIIRVSNVFVTRMEALGNDLRHRTAETVAIWVYLVFSVVFGTIGVLVFERGADSGFDTLADALWWCIVTLTTVGYGDRFPVTVGGRVVATILMFIGLSFYALLTGMLSTLLIRRAWQEEGSGMQTTELREHIVICGWNAHARRLIEDLLEVNPGTDVVVLCERTDLPPIAETGVHVVRLDPTSAEGLERAGVAGARVVIVLSDDASGRSSHDSDARTILTVLAVERMHPDVHTIAELRHEDNRHHALNAGVDELIISGSYTGTMLAQAARNPGVSHVYDDMFRAGAGSMIEHLRLTPGQVGRTFGDLSVEVLADADAILIGLRRQGQALVSPGRASPAMDGDELIVLRRQAPDVEEV